MSVPEKKTVFVTGARGYIGRYTVQLLLDNGHTVIDYNRSLREPFENPNHIPVNGECYDALRLLDVFKEYKVDTVIHFAGQSSPYVSLDVPIQTIEANLVSTITILEAARKSGINRVVMFSSECAYGEHAGEECNLQTALVPRSVYGVTKAATEMLGRVYNWKHDMSCVSIRCGQVYGGKQVTPSIIKDMLTDAANNRKYVRDTGGDTFAQLVHIDDIAYITYQCAMMDPAKVNDMAVYNAVSKGVYWKDVLKEIKSFIPDFEYEMGDGRELFNGKEEENQGVWDMSDTERDLDFHPKYTLREGLQKYYEFLKSEAGNN